MRIAVDARTVYSRVRRGTGKNLIDLYRTMAAQRPDWTFLMLHRDRSNHDDPFRGESNIQAQAVEIPGDRWNLWEHVRLPMAALAARADVLHAPANTAPHWSPVPLVVTIHDLIPLDIVENRDASRQWERAVGRAARSARRILTPSSYTRDRIVEHFGIDSGRIAVNYWAPDAACARVDDPAEIDRVRVRYGLPPGRAYFLAFGAADPRKNTRRILQAWAGLDREVRARAGLLIVGLQGPILEELRGELHQLVTDDGCALAGFADEADLPALISGAEALCYPSLSEGFGLPVLDAFACRTPVLTSTTTSLPEVAGDAALLVDPTDTDAIRQGLLELATRPEVRDTLRARGAERLALFSWERCATTAANVLAEAA